MGTVLSILESRWRLGLVVSFVLYGMNTVLLGVWELGGKRHHRHYGHHGNWFAVRTDPNPSVDHHLPYGWWPYAIAQAVFGQDEWVLRLPNYWQRTPSLHDPRASSAVGATAFLSVLLLASVPSCFWRCCHNIKYASAARHQLGMPCLMSSKVLDDLAPASH